MNRQMPVVNIEQVSNKVNTETFENVIEPLIATRGKNKGQLRASKPKIDYTIEQGRHGWDVRKPTFWSGCAAYVWRMVAFMVSPKPEHHCMPVCATFDLPYSSVSKEGKALIKALDKIVDMIVDIVPANQWHGVIRWGEAYGMIGKPQATEEGAIVYRVNIGDYK